MLNPFSPPLLVLSLHLQLPSNSFPANLASAPRSPYPRPQPQRSQWAGVAASFIYIEVYSLITNSTLTDAAVHSTPVNFVHSRRDTVHYPILDGLSFFLGKDTRPEFLRRTSLIPQMKCTLRLTVRSSYSLQFSFSSPTFFFFL